MDFLGVGPLELLFIIIIALIVLGPRDMSKAMRTIGRGLRKLTTSETWQAITRIRYLPNVLMREAGLEELNQEMKKELSEAQEGLSDLKLKELQEDLQKHASVDLSDWTTAPSILPSPPPPTLEEDQNETGVADEDNEGPTLESAPPGEQEMGAVGDGHEGPTSLGEGQESEDAGTRPAEENGLRTPGAG